MVDASERMRPLLAITLWVLGAAACGSSTSGNVGKAAATANGTTAGRPFMAEDAAGVVGTWMTQDGLVEEVDVLIAAGFNGICGRLQQPQNVGQASDAILALATFAASPSGSVTPGTYPVTATGLTGALYGPSLAYCQSAASETAQSGTVTFTAIDGATISGSFDLTFQNGDHLTGTFSAPVCDAPLSAVSQQSPHAVCPP
jgi:hypothetical protein